MNPENRVISPEEQREINRIFSEAWDLTLEERAVFLDDVCRGKDMFRREVEALLAADREIAVQKKTSAQEGRPPTRTALLNSPGIPPDRPEEVSHPRVVGPYRILEVLGEGGMGVVYLAEQREPVRREVALKLIKLGMDSKEVVARFESERQALAIMNHPNIARVHDVGTAADGRPYFAMECVRGVPLTEYCDRHRLSLRERLELFSQVCQGLQHAHHKGIIHRDIKPSNILVSTPDEKPVAKIIDFGVAKATNQRLTEKTLYTELGRAVGTPQYMSPEQAEMTAEDVDHRTDVYSLGVLLYELLVGELPLDWEALSKVAFDEILRRIREEEPLTPSVRWTRLSAERTTKLATQRNTDAATLKAQLRGELDWICMKALEKERSRRYSTPGNLVDDISRHLSGESVMAGPPSTMYRVRKFVRRYRVPVTATAAVVLALTLGVVASVLFALKATENERAARREELEARRRLDEVLRLADVKNLETYTGEAENLWPASAHNDGAMDRWLEKARILAERLDLHREALEKLRRKALGRGEAQQAETSGNLTTQVPGLTWTFASTEDQWWHDTLEGLVRGLDVLSKETIPAVESRREFARTVRERTIDDYAAPWRDAVESIASESECPHYRGLRLVPQEGLIPLGRDPDSHLWEFGHLQTGDLPKRDKTGKLILGKETGLVFVLIPGGTFWMGAMLENKESRLGSRNIDPEARPDESPVHEITLEPFFLSKYEMTQGQWRRFTGKNPSFFNPEKPPLGGIRHSLLHPVENVSWDMCEKVLRRLGLVLPTEAQWEYAARARTTTVWWTGNEKETLKGKINVADRASERAGLSWPHIWPDLDDGYPAHAPVGTYAANPFGLHDVHGNVHEWCRDRYSEQSYRLPWRTGDGERQVAAPGSDDRVYRGGGFALSAFFARSAERTYQSAGYYNDSLGVRPARVVDRE